MASSVLRNLPKTFCARLGLGRPTLSWNVAVSFRDILWVLAGEMGRLCCRRLLREGWLLLGRDLLAGLEEEAAPSLGKRLDNETPVNVPVSRPLCSIILTSQHQLSPA